MSQVADIINLIEIGDLLYLENFIKDFKLLPLPDINTAVLTLLIPVNIAIEIYFSFTRTNFSDNIRSIFF